MRTLASLIMTFVLAHLIHDQCLCTKVRTSESDHVKEVDARWPHRFWGGSGPLFPVLFFIDKTSLF